MKDARPDHSHFGTTQMAESQKMFPPLSGSTRPRYGLNRIALEPLRERES